MSNVRAFLASLRLSVLLMVALLLALAAGTLVEARVDAPTAIRFVYRAPWFLVLEGLFALNVAMSLVDRFPWGKARVGFVILHGSLLVVLIGAAVTYLFKVEGTLALWEGEERSEIVRVDEAGREQQRWALPFAVRLEDFVVETHPGTSRPARFESRVRITDPETGQAFPARIWMNHELHHRGFVLHQSGYQQQGEREMTVLAVSKDPGQPIVFTGFFGLLAGMAMVFVTRLRTMRERKVGGRGAALLLLIGMLAGTAWGQDTLERLRRLPVQHDGRVMPFDTLARDYVWTLTGQMRWHGEDPVRTLSRWLDEPRSTLQAPILKVGPRTFVQTLALPEGTSHASFLTLAQNRTLGALLYEARRAEAQGLPRRGSLKDAEALLERMMALKALLFQEAVRPQPVPDDPRAPWLPLEEATSQTLAALMTGPRPALWPHPDAIEREIFYNRLHSDRWAWVLLLGAWLLAVVAWKRPGRFWDGAAFLCLLAGFGMMTWGIVLRWQIAGRIPAANMYESLLFLGWGVGLVAVIAYVVLRHRIVVLTAAMMAALTMALVDGLPIDPFLRPMPPVLAGTAWLAIHVPIIMLGYAVLTLGMGVAHLQIAATVLAPRRTDLHERFAELNDGYTFVGSWLLLAGILTGSMWAASSWGRYWGWDPKEVWSLVAFLAYMAILHARLDGLVGAFGMAVLSVLGYQTILMTYLGVNFVLGTGLHSYGMGDHPIVGWMGLVALLELGFLGWASWSYRQRKLAAPEIEPEGVGGSN